MALGLKKPEELIRFMKEQNIRFELFSEEDTIKFLGKSTYYKKISSYKDNFQTYIAEGKKKYRDLDFAYLKELSSIDAELRRVILAISLNIEHSVKVKIINKCTEQNFNGYDIAERFLDKYPKVKDNILRYVHNSYCEELIRRHQNKLPIWVIVEVVSFGDLCLLYKFIVDCDCFGLHTKAELRDSVSVLYSVHDIRNAAAHNHCLIRNLTYSNNVSTCAHMISQYIAAVEEISDTQRGKALKTKFYYDFTCLLYAVDYFLESENMKNKAKNSLREFMNGRAVKNKSYFKNCIPVKNTFIFFQKVIDFYMRIE